MQQQNIPIGTLVDMYMRGEIRVPEAESADRMNAFISEKAAL